MHASLRAELLVLRKSRVAWVLVPARARRRAHHPAARPRRDPGPARRTFLVARRPGLSLQVVLVRGLR